ncbi:MAG: GIY-YIG nuclease family protein [candidate division SR1 bacterium]|nr:GIY-YIG nuclease family protein [candidate division SR1 bacterium]
MYYVYILKGDKYYCGYTNDIDRRIFEHQEGKTYTTQRIGEFKLLGFFIIRTKSEAIKLEREIKKSGHIERYIKKNNFIIEI